MSILGYSTAYFLPQYWVNTPLYGEKLIPLLDYILSTDYEHTDLLATAFFDITSKYTNTKDLSIDKLEAVIEENGYGYIRDLLGDDEDSLRLLVYILVLIHQLKGSKRGIETVLNLLKSSKDELEFHVAGFPDISKTKVVTGFSSSDFVFYSNFNLGNDPFEITFELVTGNNFNDEQCIASAEDYGFYLGIDTSGKLVISLGQQTDGIRSWQSIDGETRALSQKILVKNSLYYIKFIYTGTAYAVTVSTDNNKYSSYISVSSKTPLDIVGGNMYLGIDKSISIPQNPFNGSIFLAPFSVISKNVKVTQWFEVFPMDEEDTFSVDADVDMSLVNSEFFINFAKFTEKYVYPTLKLFRAKMSLKNLITYLPYVRQRVTYIASNNR